MNSLLKFISKLNNYFNVIIQITVLLCVFVMHTYFPLLSLFICALIMHSLFHIFNQVDN